jgi:hypothetical protein
VSPAAASAARRQGLWLFALSLGLRLAMVAFAARRFPPADDGTFYHAVATRIASGHGYTWAWPDGAVTHAAHYPVGYPALLGAAYFLVGPAPWAGMVLGAALGSLLVVAVHSIALRFTSLKGARLAGLMVALHPTLVLYTAALMTEAVAAAVLVGLAALALQSASRPRWWSSVPLGLGGGVLVLLRPQLLPLLPVLGVVAASAPVGCDWRAALRNRARSAALVTLLGLLCCLPWTLRNCQKMDGCVFVSANGGWNLLIGTLPAGKGSFAPIVGDSVPLECREVFGEVEKDRCFGRAGMRRILDSPVAWLALAPQKLGQLFDHGAVASSYLAASGPRLVGDRVKLAIASVETVCSRLLLLAAALGLLRAGALRGASRGFALAAGVFALSPWGGLAQLCLLSALLAGWRSAERARPLWGLSAVVLAMCVVTHMVFFGAPRYALLWLPWLSCLAVLPRSVASDGRPARVF